MDILRPTNNYQEEGVHAKLPEMPEDEQPSWGWKWFCRKYGIASLGIGPEAWGPQESNLLASGAEDELRWGYPFWDVGRLNRWGVMMTSASTTVEA
jgi:hypothetical protein